MRKIHVQKNGLITDVEKLVVLDAIVGFCWMRAAYVKVPTKSQNISVGYGGVQST
jgi:hypothetical protein